MSRVRPRVAVLYNAPVLPADHPHRDSEFGVVRAAKKVAEALGHRGFRPFLLAARPPAQRLVRSLVRKSPDLVFNLIEGFAGRSRGEPLVTSLLELMGLPYTGCPPFAQALGRRKGGTKRMLLGAGLPTAAFSVLGPDDPVAADPWVGPVLVKPDGEDASLGITQASVVESPDCLAAQVESVRSSLGGDVMVEAYLPGPEFNVGVLALPEPAALPAAEVAYRDEPGSWPILTYEAKWAVGSPEDLRSPVRCPAEIGPELAARLADLAVAAFRACGCRDYARVDFRLDSGGEPMILEVNPNPDLDPSAGLARAIAAGGGDWAEVVAALARQALERGPARD